MKVFEARYTMVQCRGDRPLILDHDWLRGTSRLRRGVQLDPRELQRTAHIAGSHSWTAHGYLTAGQGLEIRGLRPEQCLNSRPRQIVERELRCHGIIPTKLRIA